MAANSALDAQATPSAAGSSAPSRVARLSIFKFSLATFLLMATLAAVVASHVATTISLLQAKAQIGKQQKEIASLRDELGYFEVKDKSLIHVRFVPTLEENVWRWRLHLPSQPAGRRYRIHFATQKIPAMGFPPSAPSTTAVAGESPLLFELGVHRGTDGRTQVVIRMGGSMSRTILEDTHALIAPATMRASSTDIAGDKQLQTAKTDERLQLLRLRVAAGDPNAAGQSTVTVPTTPCDGILVWIEPEK